MDMLYLTADSYLGQLADRSGGQLYKADTLASLPQAFAAIAAELRTQYLLGYYPPTITATVRIERFRSRPRERT
jgi:hypothetical protein